MLLRQKELRKRRKRAQDAYKARKKEQASPVVEKPRAASKPRAARQTKKEKTEA